MLFQLFVPKLGQRHRLSKQNHRKVQGRNETWIDGIVGGLHTIKYRKADPSKD